MEQVAFVPEGRSGDYSIQRMVKEEYSLRDMIRANERTVPPGTYTMLYRKGVLVMSDTPSEMYDHLPMVQHAKGHCLIAGLGIGMVLNAVLQKSEVHHVVVVEREMDVIRLVWPTYEQRFGARVSIVHADVFRFVPPRVFDAAWFDIWDTLCVDNLKEMALLARKFGKRATWKGFWGKEFLLRQRAHGKQRSGKWPRLSC